MDKLFQMSSKSSNFNLDDIKSESVTIAITATETSSVASATLLLMLALHPNYQNEIFKEVLSVMPKKNSSLNYADLNKLTFMDQCIDETLRLFPPITIIPRESNKPLKLNNGVIVPPGVPLIIGVRNIHRDEKNWGLTANIFDPSRFEKSNLKNIPVTGFIPFSYGPRNCVGNITI